MQYSILEDASVETVLQPTDFSNVNTANTCAQYIRSKVLVSICCLLIS